MNEKTRKYIAKLESNWPQFLENLADKVHPSDPRRLDWTPDHESWFQLVRHLDGIAAAYVAWQGTGCIVNEHEPVDDARILELIEPCGFSETDQHVFLLACKQLLRDFRELQPRSLDDEGDEEPETNGTN